MIMMSFVVATTSPIILNSYIENLLDVLPDFSNEDLLEIYHLRSARYVCMHVFSSVLYCQLFLSTVNMMMIIRFVYHYDRMPILFTSVGTFKAQSAGLAIRNSNGGNTVVLQFRPGRLINSFARVHIRIIHTYFAMIRTCTYKRISYLQKL